MNRITILHVAQCGGGVDCYLRMLLSHMDRRRFRQIVIGTHEHVREAYAPLTDDFVQIDMRNALSPKADLKAVLAVRQLIRRYKPAAIYLHSSKAGGVGRLAAVGLGVPVVYNPHGWAFRIKGAKSHIYLWLERLLAPLTTQYVTISNFEKLAAVQCSVAKASKIRTIFNGIDLKAVEQQTAKGITRRTAGIPDDAFVVGMVGRISAQKAPDTFVRMAAEVAKSIANAYFVIVGDGDERTAIERQIAAAGLTSRFLITGWTDTPLAYAALFDIATLLSRWEGFGLVLAEYMALGKPIVATDTDAIPDLITDYDNGRLVPVDNHHAAAAAVHELHDNKQLTQNMTEKGQMRARALFDIQRTAKEHERLFVRLCQPLQILVGGGSKHRPVTRTKRAAYSVYDAERWAA